MIVRVFRDPCIVDTFASVDWDILIRQARRGDVLGTLCALLHRKNLISNIPAAALAHLTSAWALAQKHERVLRWEINRINKAIEKNEVPVVLLKGAAYLTRNIWSSQGRLYADIDIMVPKSNLPEVEHALLIHGWIHIKQDEYDQYYYREWMHEIPPMRHRRRQTVIDVHHRILPVTAKAQPDPEKLFNCSQEVDSYKKLRTLSDVDMVLHSATHLFYEGDLSHGLRDLIDLQCLIETFEHHDEFWSDLVSRADELDLGRPLFYALRYLEGFLGLNINREVLQKLDKYSPSYLIQITMDSLYQHALVPDHTSCKKPLTGIARWMLYTRAHFLRMPFYLLIPHLIRKSIRKNKTGSQVMLEKF